MEKEWDNMIKQVKADGVPAVRIHRGAKARELLEKYADRIVPSRWMNKWKDMGDEFDTPLPPQIISASAIPAHHGRNPDGYCKGFMTQTSPSSDDQCPPQKPPTSLCAYRCWQAFEHELGSATSEEHSAKA